MPTLAIFGAGPALGRSTAHRFAREGYDLALIARNPHTLADLTTELQHTGRTVRTVQADLADPPQAIQALTVITTDAGGPDVVLYAPGDVGRLPVPASDLDAATLQTWLALNLLTPVELAHALVPAMVTRGSGALLVAQGAAAVAPVPAMASSSVPQAALLHYLHALSSEVSGHGVRIASLLIGQLIDGSAAAELFDRGHFGGVEPDELPRVDPDQLAEQLWTIAHHGAEVVNHAQAM